METNHGFLFKKEQKDILETLYKGRNVFGVMPTGYGKSHCFGLFAQFLKEVSINENKIS